MREISIQEFIEDYAEALISDVVVVKNRIYGRSVKGQADNPDRYEVVWAAIP